MIEPIRVTAETIGSTTFHRTKATLEWTVEGRLRVVSTPPTSSDRQPEVLLDAAPAELSHVSNHTHLKPQLVITPRAGSAVRVSLAQSRLDPLPGAPSGAPSEDEVTAPQWWARTLADSGVRVVTWDAGRTWALIGAIAAATAIVTLGLLAVVGVL